MKPVNDSSLYTYIYFRLKRLTWWRRNAKKTVDSFFSKPVPGTSTQIQDDTGRQYGIQVKYVKMQLLTGNFKDIYSFHIPAKYTHYTTLFTLPELLSSPPVLSGVRVTRSLVLYVFFVDRCLSFCTFSFGHCVTHLFFDIRILIVPLVSSNSSCLTGRNYERNKIDVP